MVVCRNIAEVREYVKREKSDNHKIGFVPTMGALHDGHLSLVKNAIGKADCVVMSIFVNKIQFNDKKDFEKYPRIFDEDFKKAEEAGVDMVFLPDDEMMYKNHKTYVDVEYLTETLCGKYREGHFRGVYTVVAKLFNIVTPDIAFFGQKDIQQALTIEKMVFDLNMTVEIEICPIIRDLDGLALSSRNVHLSADERKRALSIVGSFEIVEEMIIRGELSANSLKKEVEGQIGASSPKKIDYISIVDYNDLHEVDDLSNKAVLAVAVYYGDTRLIDNMIIDIAGEKKCVY